MWQTLVLSVGKRVPYQWLHPAALEFFHISSCPLPEKPSVWVSGSGNQVSLPLLLWSATPQEQGPGDMVCDRLISSVVFSLSYNVKEEVF